jgi:hypothetical protein
MEPAPTEAEAPSSSVPAAEEATVVSGMRRNDEQLREMLALARGCLRSKRVPGEIRERDLFEQWDAKAQAAVQAEGTSSPSRPAPAPVAPAAPPPPPVPPTPEGLSAEQRLAKLRRDVQRLERLTAEKRQELEDTNAALCKAVLDRCKVQEELQAVQDEAQSSRKEIRNARGMVRRQERETHELRDAIRRAKAAGAAASTDKAAGAALADKGPRNGAAGAEEEAGPAPGAARVSLEKEVETALRAALAAEEVAVAPEGTLVTSEPPEAPVDDEVAVVEEVAADANGLVGGHDPQAEPPSPRVLTTLSMQELKDALLGGNGNEGFRNENEKLASVIDAVGELSRRVHEPGGLSAVEDGFPGGEGACPGPPPDRRDDGAVGGGGRSGSRGSGASKAEPRRRPKGGGRKADLWHLGPNDKAYTSVLSGKPRSVKDFIG